ncbi:hypothetical protein ACH5BF_02150 [Arcobacter sp. YIC-464]|uniref:hypothetical protein n=1 Tax=Arcobacter sp. YIC-464 TaxID=3376631 RepID=UPI003C23DF53
MQLIEQGFEVNYTLQKMGLIKVGGSGTMDNGHAYPASLKIRTSNLTSEYDEELGEVDREELLEFKIPCDTNVQAGELNRLFRDLKANGIIVPFNGGLPRKYPQSEYATVTVTDKADELFEKLKKLKAPTSKPNDK